jgi:membrane fusion protein (multidrug efflux system)
MFARARIVLKERGSAVMVPEEAVYPMGADVFVYKIIDGKAMRARVATGVRRDGKVEITEGVVVGDLVVTAGQIKLARDGTEVRVQSAGGGPRGGGASDSGAASGGGAASDGGGASGGGGQGGAPKGPATRPAG